MRRVALALFFTGVITLAGVAFCGGSGRNSAAKRESMALCLAQWRMVVLAACQPVGLLAGQPVERLSSPGGSQRLFRLRHLSLRHDDARQPSRGWVRRWSVLRPCFAR